MAEAPSASEIFIFDSSALIDIEIARRANELPTPGTTYLVPPRVRREVNKRGTPLANWLSRRGAKFTGLLPEEHSIYFALITGRDIKIHDAEATAIAMAMHRNGVLVISDGPARRKAEAYGVRCMSGQEFLALMKPRLPGL